MLVAHFAALSPAPLCCASRHLIGDSYSCEWTHMRPSDNLLVIIRHGQSETNAAGIFTGLDDPPLTARGRDEAVALGPFLLEHFPATHFDHAYTSRLQRASTTLDLLLSAFPSTARPPITVSSALNERDYGLLNGRSKAQVADEYPDQIEGWRRGFSDVPPGGESLEMTVRRVVAYYEAEIKPRLMKGERILLVSHGNTLRGLVMALEGHSAEEVKQVELGYGATRAYSIDPVGGEVVKKQRFTQNGVEGGWSQ